MTTSPQPERSFFNRARAAALWVRDTGLGILGFAVVLVVALLGWTVSFIGLHTFAMQHMELTWQQAWYVPGTFDGAAAGLSIVVMRAGARGRRATLWRILIIVFTLLSAWINWVHITDAQGRLVSAIMPPAAVIVFEGIMSEVRAAAKERQGSSAPLRVHPMRWFFDRTGTLDLYRRHILNLPVPIAMQEAIGSPLPQRAPAAPPAGSPNPATVGSGSPAPASTAAPGTASPAQTANASPGSTTAATPDSVYLPAPANKPASPAPSSQTATASTSAQAASQPPTATPGSKTTAGSEQRDLDEVADTYRKLAAELGRTPSDAKLAEALGVGRSRAQQLRTAAIEAGHTDLAKPLRAAS